MNEPRNWKWSVPLMVSPVTALLSLWLFQFTNPVLTMLAAVPGMATVTLLILAIGNFVRYQVEWTSDVAERRNRALNITPVTMLADALRGMHPEAVKVLDKYGVRTRWGVGIDMDSGNCDWILLDTSVHLGFVEYVLNNSTNFSLYPLNRFSEGSKKWDPDGLVEDRDQYRQFEGWLNARLIVTRAFGNHPAQFIPPWTPDRVREVMRIGDEMVEAWQPESSPTPSPSPNGKERNLGRGDGVMDDLIPLRR